MISRSFSRTTVWAVVEPNGAGKSTLIRAMCGDQRLAHGHVDMEAEPLARWPRRKRAQRLAVMPQHVSLSFPFDGLDVVLMGRTPHLRGAESLTHRIYSTLSGGERQRVQLARVLAQIWEPPDSGGRYLLLDEPTASLDLAHQHHTLATVRQLARRGVGVLVVLHDFNLAAQYGDRILVLNDGQAHRLGAPWEVITPDLIQAVFGIAVQIMPHPCGDGPLVVPIPHGLMSR